MKYIIYKITNKIDGKYYIGKHKTANLDDGYMGSGKLLKRAIEKYGLENFTKEILFIFDNEQEMNNKEKELVVVSEETYNLCSGGHGGFDYINKNYTSVDKKTCLAREKHLEYLLNDNEYKKNFSVSLKKRSLIKLSTALKLYYKINGSHWVGRKHKEESKRKISEANKKMIGPKNSQYGTCWITNGSENKKIKKEDLNDWIELGYSKGRL